VVLVYFDNLHNPDDLLPYASLSWFSKTPLDLVGVGDFHTADGVGGAHAGDGALVAVDAEVVHDLQVEGAISEGSAALYAFGAAHAELLIDDIFEVGFFDELAGDGRSGAQLVFAAGVEGVASRLEIAATEVAIPAEVVSVDALDGRGGQDAVGGAPSALGTQKGVDLPHPLLPGHTGRRQSADAPQGQGQGKTHSSLNKLPAAFNLIVCHGLMLFP